MTQPQQVIRELVAIADPNNSTNAIPNTAQVTSDGKLKVDATVTATAESTAEATAANPTYTEAQDAPLSQDLSGRLRTIATPIISATMTATQVTVPSTANGIVILAANSSRKGATISNPGSVPVYIQQGSTGVTTSNGFAVPAGSSYNIDSPLYTGAIYGIVGTGSQVVTVVELT